MSGQSQIAVIILTIALGYNHTGRVAGNDLYRWAYWGIAWALTIAAWECRTLRRQRQRSRAIPLEQARDLSGAAESPEAQKLSGCISLLAFSRYYYLDF